MNARDSVDIKNEKALSTLLTNYPAELKSYINSLSNKTSYTKLAYTRYIIYFLDYARENKIINSEYDFTQIKPMHISDYMNKIKYNDNHMEKSASYRSVQLSALNSFFIFLEKNDIIRKNPCSTIEFPRDRNEHKVTVITDQDLEIIMNNIKNGTGTSNSIARHKKYINRDLALIILGLTTGLRVSAIVGIDVDDINLGRNTIRVTEKRDETFEVFIGKNTKKYLVKWLADRKKMCPKGTKAVFIREGGNRITTRTVQNIMKRSTEGIDKRITPHKMRATCATRLYEATGDALLVMSQLNHKNIETTKRYIKVSEKRKRDAASILDSLC